MARFHMHPLKSAITVYLRSTWHAILRQLKFQDIQILSMKDVQYWSQMSITTTDRNYLNFASRSETVTRRKRRGNPWLEINAINYK